MFIILCTISCESLVEYVKEYSNNYSNYDYIESFIPTNFFYNKNNNYKGDINMEAIDWSTIITAIANAIVTIVGVLFGTKKILKK
nr:MAG TPA: hypothetical protein [Microviridae sp.]